MKKKPIVGRKTLENIKLCGIPHGLLKFLVSIIVEVDFLIL